MEWYLSQAKHSDKKIAELFGTTEVEISQKISKLLDLGAIRRGPTHYHPTDENFDTGARGTIRSKKIMDYYRKRILDESPKSENANPNLTSAFLEYHTDPELDEKVFELCRNFYVDLKNLISSEVKTVPKKNIRFVSIELFYPLGKNISD